MFVDKVKVTFKAGDGGDGLTSFRHEKFRARGGPDGGDGGDGGDILLVAKRNLNTLSNFRYKKLIASQPGKNGQRSKKHGKSGQILTLNIPVGTVISDPQGVQLADLTKDGQEIIIAKGGKGGFGNAHFVSSTRQAPQVAEKGEKGELADVTLELKMIADVGIIGLPNAGKSTLLSVISNAKPDIADYPFTTLKPNLGVVDINKNFSLLFADIPGLIEGASHGKGLGDEFLKHVERTRILVHLIDSYSSDVAEAYSTIIKELQLYKQDLADRPQIVALTKVEGLDKKQLAKLINKLKKAVPKSTAVLAISAKSGEGLNDLLRIVEKVLSKPAKKQPSRKMRKKLSVIGLRREFDDWTVQQRGDDYLVTGKKIERFASRTKFGDYYGEQRLRDIMYKMGIIQELEKKGIKPNHKIQIGNPLIGEIEF